MTPYKLQWFWVWLCCFCSFVGRKDGYFDPRAKYCGISDASRVAKIIANTCIEIRKERKERE